MCDSEFSYIYILKKTLHLPVLIVKLVGFSVCSYCPQVFTLLQCRGKQQMPEDAKAHRSETKENVKPLLVFFKKKQNHFAFWSVISLTVAMCW